jgi:hypothetical protein
MLCWLLHFYNKETFKFTRQNHNRYGRFNQDAAVAAYRRQCDLLKTKPATRGTFTSQLSQIKKKMCQKKIKKLTKKYLGSDAVVKRAYARAQKHAKIKSALTNGIRAMNRETAIYQATALGHGFLAKLDRQRMAQTLEAKKQANRINFDKKSDGSEEKKSKRKLKRVADYVPGKRIPGLRTSRTTMGRGTPSHSSTPEHESVSRMVRHRVEGSRAETWTKHGIAGVSLNAKDGMIFIVC